MLNAYKLFFTKNYKLYFITAIILFAVFFIYYSLILYLRIGTDVQVHAGMAFMFFNGKGSITPNFLYYFLVALLAGFSKYKVAYYASSIILLCIAIVFKFFVNVYYLKKYLQRSGMITAILAIMLVFVFCLPGLNFFQNKDFYLGQLAPNVWHNSTVIFLAPFSIMLFFETINFINQKVNNRSQQFLIFILVVLNAFIKPSFLFTIIPVVLLWALFRIYRLGLKRVTQIALPYFAGFFLIVVEYILIYKLNNQSGLGAKEQSSVIVSPFEMWGHFSANMLLSFITSCLFPIVYIFYTKGELFKNKIVSFACLNFLFAILIWILFIETGFRRYHGNFYWQVVIANYLLFFSMMIHLLSQSKKHFISTSSKRMIFAIFVLHFIWGVIYWAKIIWFHGYS